MFARLFLGGSSLIRRVNAPTYARFMCVFSKENSLQTKNLDQDFTIDPVMPNGKPKKSGKMLEDFLELLKYRDSEETLRLVEKYPDMMTSHHVFRCYGNIKRHLSGQLGSLRSDPRFQALCIMAGKKATYFGPKQCATMIEYLVDLDFDSDSVLLQMFIQLSMHHVNELTITDLTRLACNIQRVTPTPQTQTATEVVASAVDVKLKFEAPYIRSDVWIDLFQNLAKYVSKETLDFILYNLKLRKDSSRFNNPLAILTTLVELNLLDKELMKICLSKLSEYFDRGNLESSDVLVLASVLSPFKWFSRELANKIDDYVSRTERDWKYKARISQLLMTTAYFPVKTISGLIYDLSSSRIEDVGESWKDTLSKILNDSEVIFGEQCAEVKLKFGLNDVETFNFSEENHRIPGLPDTQEVKVIFLDEGDFYKNVSKLRGPQFRSIQALISDGVRVFVVSKWRLSQFNENERSLKLKMKLDEARDKGYSELF